MSARDWTTTSAKYIAAFLLGGASLGGLAWSLKRQPAAKVHIAPASVHANAPAEPPPPILARSPVATPPAATPAAASAPPATEPASQPQAKTESPTLTPPSPSHKVNLNTATQEELELLPGIGPALAQRILEFRAANGSFNTVDQLDSVKGIGPRTLAKLRPLVSVD